MKASKRHDTLKLDHSIRGNLLTYLPIFLAVAELRSFTAAARSLGMSPSATSQAVARFEAELKTPLFVRTTRSVRLTDAGERLQREVGPAVRAAGAVLHTMRDTVDEPSGVLRLNVPRVASRVVLPQLLELYSRRYPHVRCEVVVDDRRVDIVKDGFDAGIRSSETIHGDMVRVRLTTPRRLVVVGSPGYLARAGRPREPRDLLEHACLGWRSLNGGSAYRWEFVHEGREIDIAVDGPILSNDTTLLLACAEQGLGLALVVDIEAEAALDRGDLETVLDDHSVHVPGLFLYFPRAGRAIPNLRALLACARELRSPR